MADASRKDFSLNLWTILATGFLSGTSQSAPGTMGTGVAVILVWMASISGIRAPFGLYGEIGLVVLFILFSVFVTAKALPAFTQNTKDPQAIVIDEFAGYFVTIIALPGHSFSLLIAFGFFRLFDILKPPPVRNVERLPGAWGIVLDDVVAGVFALIASHGTLRALDHFL